MLLTFISLMVNIPEYILNFSKSLLGAACSFLLVICGLCLLYLNMSYFIQSFFHLGR